MFPRKCTITIMNRKVVMRKFILFRVLNQNRIQGVQWPLEPHATAEGTRLLGRVKYTKVVHNI